MQQMQQQMNFHRHSAPQMHSAPQALSWNQFRQANAGLGLHRNGTGPGSMSWAYRNQ
jgi:hypothetical protein